MGKIPWSSSEKAVTERSWRLTDFGAPVTILGRFLGGCGVVSESPLSLSETRRVCCDCFRFRTCSWMVGLLRPAVPFCPVLLLTGFTGFGRAIFRNDFFFAFEELCTVSLLIELGAGGIGLEPLFCMRLKKLMLKRLESGE